MPDQGSVLVQEKIDDKNTVNLFVFSVLSKRIEFTFLYFFKKEYLFLKEKKWLNIY